MEKERLSNIMAFGEDVKPKTREQLLADLRRKEEQSKAPAVDRFDESKIAFPSNALSAYLVKALLELWSKELQWRNRGDKARLF